ncbi:MAG: copper amine oxidase N-terminal domain-containing protein [Syntrophomonas sp.]
MSKNQTITISVESIEIKLVVGSNTSIVNGKSIPMSNPPLIIDGRTYVPLGYVATSLYSEVRWIPEEQRVRIYYPSSAMPGF